MNQEIEQITKILGGDKAAFTRLYLEYYDFIYYRVYGFFGDRAEAEDVTQKVWLKIYFALGKFKGNSTFKTWIYTIATNESINHLKQQRIFVSLEDIEETLNYLQDLNSIDREIDVTNLLSTLSKEERTLILLKYVDEYTYDQIAVMTGLTPSAVKMKISRAKVKLNNYEQ